jgi:hypothetical protein
MAFILNLFIQVYETDKEIKTDIKEIINELRKIFKGNNIIETRK